jgi:hypothetical protein
MLGLFFLTKAWLKHSLRLFWIVVCVVRFKSLSVLTIRKKLCLWLGFMDMKMSLLVALFASLLLHQTCLFLSFMFSLCSCGFILERKKRRRSSEIVQTLNLGSISYPNDSGIVNLVTRWTKIIKRKAKLVKKYEHFQRGIW